MRTIEKGSEPRSLKTFRKGGGKYEDFKDTNDLRRALLRDQGHLCCYCMARITENAMKNEHWASQSGHADRTVDWDNLMGACKGGDGERRAIKHCDTSRGNKPLKVNPLDRAQGCERLIRYRHTGEVASDDPRIHEDLHVTLNLNNERLRRARQKILDTLLHKLAVEKRGFWSPELIAGELSSWRRRDEEGRYREYCQVAIYWLEKRLRSRKSA